LSWILPLKADPITEPTPRKISAVHDTCVCSFLVYSGKGTFIVLVSIGTKVVDNREPFIELKIIRGPISNILLETIKSQVCLIFPLAETVATGVVVVSLVD
jgi:hypothetical protein